MAELDTVQKVWQARQSVLQGDQEKTAQQHASGKLTARERVMKLLDEGSFIETDAMKADCGAVAGCGTVDGRVAYVFAQDYTVRGGAMCERQAQKAIKLMRLARLNGGPVVLLLDSAGAYLSEGAVALNAYARVLSGLTALSGVCPIISVVMGPCLGSAAMLASISDIVIRVEKTSRLELHASSVSGEEMTGDVLNAAGMAHITAATEDEALATVCRLLNLLPACNVEDAPLVDSDDLNRLVDCEGGASASQLMEELSDRGSLIELSPNYGSGVRTALCKLGGRTVGLVATDRDVDDGRLTAAGCEKAARFIRFLDSYHLPIVTLIDSDGFAVSKGGEQVWQMRAAGQLCYACAEATSPKVAVITGSAVGGAFIALGGSRMADITYAWPGAFISPLTAQAATATLFDEQLSAGEDRQALEKAYTSSVSGAYAAQQGVVDDLIDPKETRKFIIASLETLASKHEMSLPKKHGNMPL